MNESKTEVAAYIGLGSNVGPREQNLKDALQALSDLGGCHLGSISSVYETEPWGLKAQDDFLNQVVEIKTTLSPHQLFDACQQIEKNLGRINKEKWGPRLIDIDILLYSDLQLEEKELVIPHPHLTGRRFVLAPLAEVASDFMIPGFWQTVGDALASCQDDGKVHMVSAVTIKGGDHW